MITSIFSKSKPINFIMVAGFVIVLFVVSNFNQLFADVTTALKTSIKLVVAVFFVFLLDFIISKNNLTKKNGYAIMTFGLLFGLFPEALRYSDLLFANLFVLFALRRLISLQTNLHTKKKFFDAGFWVMMATLFHFWSVLFFAVVIVALIYHSKNNLKNVIIPFVGVATVILLLVAYNIIVHDTYIKPTNFSRYASVDYSVYNSVAFIIKFTVLFASFLWTLIYFFRSIPDKNKKLKPSFFLIAWSSVIAILIAIIAPVKNGSEFIFLFAPFSIIMANYIEVVSEKWFKEVFISLLILAPIISLML
ncbi:DUF6427 family protein [Winogradskyella marincola]|uniref:DUF6427 family protein n=1 Tax=Winogradskyella marincola TaxID=3037795 RepID=A0ABT6FZG0_9FLAO|nr:DUF6427 family protein [Winogradskyella sp. YYF002]MDG4715182.1 DUF6427 family protein [Winogradskyella sp. YYF002]